MKKSSYLFYSTLIIGSLMTISSNNWMSMWIGLELNMMSFIPIMLTKINKSTSESALIYFMVQSISSMILMMMVTINMWNYLISEDSINMIITMALMIKMGAAPFHFWLPEVMAKMEWMKCIIIMSWQKVAPLYMLSNTSNNSMLMNMIICTSIMIGSVGGLNQSSLRKMMAYSSINHLGWMMAINKSMNKWTIYLTIYSLMATMICLMFYNKNLYFINQLGSINMHNMEKMSMFMMMLSFGGLPPFLGFLPKWIAIQSLINEKELFILIIMIMFSLINLMFYIRIMTSMILSFSVSIKWQSSKINKMLMSTMIISNLSLPMIMIMDLI
nr:TPA_asm: NADH dehydrogenase subunit 2 [Euschistus heros]